MDNWQSWSPGEKRLIKWPARSYCPIKETAQPAEKPKDFKLTGEITGWCSWYGYGRNINEEIILAEAKAIKEKKIEAEYILIDDGWCQWGQWTNPNKNRFPGGMKKVSEEIKNMGFKPGIWMTPFLSKNNFGFNKKHILNFGKEENKTYIFNCLDKILGEWKFELIKLDFLYAPYFLPGLKTDLRPTEYLRAIFSYIKKNFSDVYIMACGCPFEAAKYLVDSIRVSDDVAVPSLRNFKILNNLIIKKQVKMLKKKWGKFQDLNQYFNLDPDVMISDQGVKDEGWIKLWEESKVRFWGNRFADLD